MSEQNISKSYYAIIPANVRYDEDLTANSKLLYGEITALSNDKGFCWASNAYFANLYKTTNRTIIRWIGSLEQKGYIRTEIVFDKESKAVTERRLYIVTGDKNVTGGSDKNVTHNNTVSNTTVYKHIVEYLNSKAGTSYKPTTGKTQTCIRARLNEGFTEDDFKRVIDIKTAEWLDTDMAKFLRPETLFGNKFEGYLNQKSKKPDTYEPMLMI